VSSCALFRLSGPASLSRVEALAAGGVSLPQTGFRGVRILIEAGGTRVPAYATVFRAPRSYTREDMVELSVPGSPPLLGLLLRTLVRGERSGVRVARPGEFTLRAFLNGRLDLSQAESVAGLIAAASEEEASAARRSLRGDLRGRLDRLARGATECLALIEAALDFPDEDLPQVSPAAVRARLAALRGEITDLRRSSLLRGAASDALRVVLAGFPNAGKSSLFNALLGREVAIVASVPGTTRDPVRAVTSWEGQRIEWVDLAGTCSAASLGGDGGSSDAGERSDPAAGLVGRTVCDRDAAVWDVVRRLTRVEVRSADCVLWVLDPLEGAEESLGEFRRLGPDVQKELVVQKSDLIDARTAARLEALPERPLLVSAHRRAGLDALVERVAARGAAGREKGGGSGRGREGGGPAPFLLSAHQEAALELALEDLERAMRALGDGLGYEYVAADLRDALGALEGLTGRVTPDAILDQVFSRFCVGK
jgi:tRNA modification GTPase